MDLPANRDEIERIYMELKGMHSSGMIPFVAGVDSDVPSLAECLEDCTVFVDGHMELLNELAREMVVWENDEKASSYVGASGHNRNGNGRDKESGPLHPG